MPPWSNPFVTEGKGERDGSISWDPPSLSPPPHPYKEQFLWPEQPCNKGREAKINVKLSFSSCFLQHTLCINYRAGGGGKRKVNERFLFVVWVKLLAFKKIQENRGNLWNICETASLSHSQQIISVILVQSDNQKQWDHGSNQASQTIPRLNFPLPAPPPTIHPQNLILSQISPLRAEILNWQLSPPISLHPGIKAR